MRPRVGRPSATALAIATLVAALAGGTGLLLVSETQAVSGDSAAATQSRQASPPDGEPIMGRLASELFLEYLRSVIARR